MTSILKYNGELLAHNGSLLNAIKFPVIDISASGGDEGLDETYCRTLNPSFLWQFDYFFEALSVPDRMILTFSNGIAINTGYISFDPEYAGVSKKSPQSGSIKIQSGKICVNVKINVKPGFVGTAWYADLEFIPYEII